VAEGRQSDVSQARHITLAYPRRRNDPLRHNFLHNEGVAGVVKFFASGVEGFAHDAGDVVCKIGSWTHERKNRSHAIVPLPIVAQYSSCSIFAHFTGNVQQRRVCHVAHNGESHGTPKGIFQPLGIMG
jgi:hypothetical protein